MHFAIRYLTEYRYDGAGHRQPQRAAGEARRRRRTQSVEDFGVARRPRGAAAPAPRLLRHDGDRVRRSRARTSTWSSTSARAWRPSEPAEPPAGRGRRSRTAPTAPRPASSCCRSRSSRAGTGRSTSWSAVIRADTPLATVRALFEVIPDRFEYRAGVTYVGSTVEDLLEGGAGVCQDFAHLALLLLRATGSRRATSPATCGRRRATRSTPPRPRSRPTRGSRRCCRRTAAASRAGSPPTRPTAGSAAGRHVKIGHGRHYADVPPIKGVFRGVAGSHMESSVRMTRAVRVPSAGGGRGPAARRRPPRCRRPARACRRWRARRGPGTRRRRRCRRPRGRRRRPRRRPGPRRSGRAARRRRGRRPGARLSAAPGRCLPANISSSSAACSVAKRT